MAQTQLEGSKPAKKRQSIDEDYSLVQPQASSAESLLKNSTWPQDESYMTTNDPPRSSGSESLTDTNPIFASHYALATAYTRVAKKLQEAERRNQALQLQDSLKSKTRSMSGSSQNNSNFSTAMDIEASVNQAWEAYNEKCKECQQLRDELATLKQQNQNAEHFSRIQDLHQDVLRERAKQDDVVRILEKTKMEADDLGKKETLAREELEKEREYQQSLMQAAEKKHRELERRIESLEKELDTEKNIKADLIRREKEVQKSMEEEFNMRREEHLASERKLEEKIIKLKEEVSVLLSLQSSAPPNMHVNGPIDPLVNHFESSQSEIEATNAIASDMEALRSELNELRTRAAEQSHILRALLENDKIRNLFRTMENKQSSISGISGYSSMQGSQPSPMCIDSGPLSTPVQCTEQSAIKRMRKSNQPGAKNAMLAQKMMNDMQRNHPDDVRQVVGSSIPSIPSADIYGLDTNAPVPGAPVVIKNTEDFIRDISRESNRRPSKTSVRNESFDFNPLFPPVGVSRVIHVPLSSQEQAVANSNAMMSNYGEHSSNSNNNFNPNMPSSSRIPNNTQASSHSTTGLQYSQYYNGNIPTHSRSPLNEQPLFPPQRPMQESYFPEERKKRMSPASSGSSSSNDTLVTSPAMGPPIPPRSKNPFYQDMGLGDGANVPTNPSKHKDPRTPQEILKNLDINSKTSSANTPKNIMDMDLDAFQPSRPAGIPPSDTNYATPSNRYISSDDDNDSDTFEQTVLNDSAATTHHHPKEFVVPKVVHASTLVNFTPNKKAFLDPRCPPPTTQQQLRPPIRAKSEQPSTSSSTPRSRRQENRTNNRSPPNHPGTESPKKTAESAVRKCPICDEGFPVDSSEHAMNRHINSHFSDDENDDLLSFD